MAIDCQYEVSCVPTPHTVSLYLTLKIERVFKFNEKSTKYLEKAMRSYYVYKVRPSRVE